jgi:hypothetical protein
MMQLYRSRFTAGKLRCCELARVVNGAYVDKQCNKLNLPERGDVWLSLQEIGVTHQGTMAVHA